MKKKKYNSPDVSTDLFRLCYALLSSSDISSSIEDFTDDNELITW